MRLSILDLVPVARGVTPGEALHRSAALATRAGQPGLFEVLLLASRPQVRGDAPERGSNLVSEASVPPDLRATVSAGSRQAWTYSSIVYLDGRSAPGLVAACCQW